MASFACSGLGSVPPRFIFWHSTATSCIKPAPQLIGIGIGPQFHQLRSRGAVISSLRKRNLFCPDVVKTNTETKLPGGLI